MAKVIYSVGTTFAGTGIGNTASKAVFEINRAGYLYKLICLDCKPSKIPKHKIEDFWPLRYLIWYPLKGIHRCIFHTYNPYFFLDSFYDFLSTKYVEKCDIFHYWRNHGRRAARIARKLGAKIVVENASSHPLTQKKLIEEEYERHGIPFKVFTEKELKKAIEELESADYVVVPQGFAYQSFIKNRFPKEKLIPVSFGIDLKKYGPSRKKRGNKKFRALFVGSVQLRKGVHYLLQAWKELKLKNSELIICGRIWNDMKEIVEKYKNNHTIKFVGFGDPKKYYEISDIFIFPTIEEGSALVTYEAMAYELPLITTFNSGTIARDNKEAFIIPIRDVKKLREKIKFMHDNPYICKKMGRAARKRVEKFPWERYGKQLIKGYKKILKDGEHN